MSSPGDTAVLVLAAGPGTRMRSDTPKVLHTIGGRSMLSHLLHAITKVALDLQEVMSQLQGGQAPDTAAALNDAQAVTAACTG